MAVTRVFADTNTLFPFYVCDLLLHRAEEDLFRVLWIEDDRVHSAAALAGRADVLLTRDAKGFPKAALDRRGLRVTTVDQFLCEQFTTFPDDLVRVVRNQVADLTKSRLTVDELLDRLSHPTGAPRFAARVRRRLK